MHENQSWIISSIIIFSASKTESYMKNDVLGSPLLPLLSMSIYIFEIRWQQAWFQIWTRKGKGAAGVMATNPIGFKINSEDYNLSWWSMAAIQINS